MVEQDLDEVEVARRKANRWRDEDAWWRQLRRGCGRACACLGNLSHPNGGQLRYHHNFRSCLHLLNTGNLTMDPAVLERVETQREALEANVAKLRKSLRHWQNLELDYEGLKEELELLPPDASTEDRLQAAREFKAVVVDENDLQSFLADDKAGSRSTRQLADLLSKRVDYVSRNADTIRKQISAEEKKLNAVLLAQDPDHQEDAGLPLTEITEELDESGNVISSKVERPGEGVLDLANVLEKAGVEGLQTKDGKVAVTEEPASAKATVASSPKSSTANLQTSVEQLSEDESDDDDDDEKRKDLPVRVPVPGENPIAVNVRDTQEEAQLRREMLEYGLDEVGAIVAELDLQEDASDVSYDEDEDVGLVMDSDFDDDDDDDAEGSEDEFGQTKKPVISEKYKQKMQELEKKLGLTDLKNLGPTPELPQHIQEAIDRPPAAEAARQAAIAREEAASKPDHPLSTAPSKGDKPKKSVAFAENLDIAKEIPSKRKAESLAKPSNNPMGETVVERSGAEDTNAPPPPAPAATKMPSRFKAARQVAASSTSTGNVAKTKINPTKSTAGKVQPTSTSSSSKAEDRPLVAPTVLERDDTSIPSAPDPVDIDDEMHRREIAMEYHKLHNRRVHAKGGFVRGDPDEDDEMDDMLSNNVLEDPETGEVKRVSRFKAARLMR